MNAQIIHKITIADDILALAKQNDLKALEALFQQFIGGSEKIEFMEYLDQYGFVLFVTHSFICVTEKRIISLQIGSFGKIVYQDAFIEDLNSSVIYQPSIFWLYVWSILLIIFFVVLCHIILFLCGHFGRYCFNYRYTGPYCFRAATIYGEIIL